MNWAVVKYFLVYIFKSRTRQKLLLLSIVGLGLSSFSLTVLQGVMGGLQHGLIKRSQEVNGYGKIKLQHSIELNQLKEIESVLQKNKIQYAPKFTAELLIKNENNIYPVRLHGLDKEHILPQFLGNVDLSNIVLGSDLGYSMNSYIGDSVTIISPAVSDLMLMELPRQAKIDVSDFISTNIPEVDSLDAWVRMSFLQNLFRKKTFTEFTLLTKDSYQQVKEHPYFRNSESFRLSSWEDENSTLVWALGLETKVMFFLFSCMCILLGICIISGNLIFYNQIKKDLASFWILGLSKNHMFSVVKVFGQLLTIAASLSGVIIGFGFLLLLEKSNITLMPEYFVERNIPVNINVIDVMKAFIIPYLIAGTFTWFTFRIFKSESISFLSYIQKN